MHDSLSSWPQISFERTSVKLPLTEETVRFYSRVRDKIRIRGTYAPIN